MTLIGRTAARTLVSTLVVVSTLAIIVTVASRGEPPKAASSAPMTGQNVSPTAVFSAIESGVEPPPEAQAVADALLAGNSPELKADLGDARTVLTRRLDDGLQVLITPGGRTFCTTLVGGPVGQSYTCTLLDPSRLSADEPPAVVLAGAGADAPVKSAYFVALVGDGVSSVTVAVESKGRQRLPVVDNVVAADLPGRPVEMVWSAPGGAEQRLDFVR